MSDVARRMRTRRQIWAAPGSSQDRFVSIARVALPVAIGVLAAFLVLTPLQMGGDVSFVLDKNKVAVAQERLKIQSATYRGEDQKGQPFAISAGSAVQKSSAQPIVQLHQLAGEIRLPDGPATVRADTGQYDMDAETVAVDGPIAVRTSDGYTLDTRDATVDLKTRTLRSDGGVTGTVPQGRFSADTLHANLTDHTVRLDGHARLHIVPRRTR